MNFWFRYSVPLILVFSSISNVSDFKWSNVVHECPYGIKGNQPCLPKSYGEGRLVCVCNSTYCDDMDPVIIQPMGSILIYTSNREGARLDLTSALFESNRVFPPNPVAAIIPGNGNGNGQTQQKPLTREVKIQIRREKLPHKILGYGGAFTDATGMNLRSLPQATQENLIRSYFGPNGIGYSLGRIPMGGCDFSPRNYTYADTPGDFNLSLFRLQPEDYFYKIPYIRFAQSISPNKIRLYGSPWTAPPWMKTNNDYIGMGLLKQEYYQLWANYFVKFLEAYQAEGFPMWGVTTQNEPFDGLVPLFPFNCMGWLATHQRDWIKNNLGPTLQRSKFADLKVIILDENTAALPRYPQEILSDKDAAQYVWGIGVHWYSTDITKHDPVLETHQMFPDTAILGTEACAGFLPWQREKVIMGSWERGEAYAEDILQGIRHHVVGWTDWNLALNTEGGPNWAKLAADSAIIVNKTSGEFYKQPMFYALAHVAKFFLPDSDVLSLQMTYSDTKNQTEVIAAGVQRPDGSIALMLLNKNDVDVNIVLSDVEQGNSYIVLPKRTMQTLLYV